MTSKYDAAHAALHQAPFDVFVAERKRLAAELEAAGDKASALRLAKVTRPPVSAWAVNQLYWRDKKAFATLFKTAEPLRDANPSAEDTAAHRDAIATLRTGAARLLAARGKAASESVLRRVTATLTALAASGGFAPDPPGALEGDRDPPGFDVAGLGVSRGSARARDAGKEDAPKREARQGERASAAERRREQAEADAERRRLEREHAREEAERERLARKLRIAQGVLDGRKEEVLRLKEKLREAEDGVKEAQNIVRELEKELSKASRS